MWLWGLNVLRFGHPASWAVALLPFVLVIPGVGAAIGRALGSLGDRAAPAPATAAVICGLLAGATALLLPDRSLFVGDSLLRFGRLGMGQWVPGLFPQAMPLDVFFHFTLPTALARAGGLSPTDVDRWTSALKAGLLGAAAVTLISAFALRGIAAVAAVATAVFAGSLAIFCGYSKAFVEMTLLTGAFAGFGALAITKARGLLPATLAFTLALATHRAAALLIAPWLVLIAMTARTHWGRGRAGRASLTIAIAGGLAALALTVPRIVAIARAVDRQHVLPGGTSAAGALRLALDPLRLIDIANLFLLLTPLVPLLVLVAVLDRTALVRSGAHRWLLLLAVLHVGAVAVVHPQQGFFRDWDIAVAAAAALSFYLAAVFGSTLSASRAPRPAGAAIALVAVASTLPWMALNTSLPHTVARVGAFVREPPPKPAQTLGHSYRYLGLVLQDSGHPEQGARVMARAVELVPSESNYLLWATLEIRSGRLPEAQRIYRVMAERFNGFPNWMALARCSAQLGDSAEVVRAAGRALELRAGDAEARALSERFRPGPARAAAGSSPR